MCAWSAVLIVSLALFAPSSSYGRGGISRGGAAVASVAEAVTAATPVAAFTCAGYTRRDGTQVGSYNRSRTGNGQRQDGLQQVDSLEQQR